MILQSLYKAFNNFISDKKLNVARQILLKTNALEEEIINLSHEEIKQRMQEIKSKIHDDQSLTSFIPEVFALTREAAKRTLQMRHFDVQIIGGYILHLGAVAEMKTGEGKTLVATLAAVLNALKGKGVHIITVNDYLTERDAKLMQPVYDFLGLSSDFIIGKTTPENRKAIYQKDIIYITNSEAVFDYLRDNTQMDLQHCVQRNLDFAIFDEADFALIDEARSPIILSGSSQKDSAIYKDIDQIIRTLDKADYDHDEKNHHIGLTAQGVNKVEEILRKNKLITEDGNLYDMNHAYINHFLNQALHAHHMLHKNTDYIIKDNQIFIVDEFTGRIMEGRRYSDGLHQAIEAKENLYIRGENQILASISLQNYARLYSKISGMTGTAATEDTEFKDIYNLDVFVIPTKEPVIRIDHNDDIYNTLKEKENAILELIKTCYEKGQPILVGTVSIEKSEKLSRLLKKHKIIHNVLNAKNHEREALIIAQAGRYKAVTIATNMAGRGTDIKLGGNIDLMLEEYVKNQKLDWTKDSEKVNIQRQFLLKEIAENAEKVFKAGGLYVLGTERHESRRIDNQLRGRSGRQGNPGESKFFISLDDDLMRLFGSNRMQSLLSSLGLKEGEVINHPMINKSISRAQKKVENHHYEIRKNLIKFDDIINKQRQIIFEKRLLIMKSNDLEEEYKNILRKVYDEILNNFNDKDNIEDLFKELSMIFDIALDVNGFQNINFNKDKYLIWQKIEDESLKRNNLLNKEEKLYTKKRIFLMIIDQIWRNHLTSLDHLRRGINLRSLGQKDPILEFQKESFEMFEEMICATNKEIIIYLSKMKTIKN